jgi:hypothetical protein
MSRYRSWPPPGNFEIEQNEAADFGGSSAEIEAQLDQIDDWQMDAQHEEALEENEAREAEAGA